MNTVFRTRIMKRLAAFTLLGALFAPHIALADDCQCRTWARSGEELLNDLSASTETEGLVVDPQLLNAQAFGYIMAMMDAEDWCKKSQVRPHDVSQRVYEHLSSLDKRSLQGNASVLVKQALDSFCDDDDAEDTE